MLNTHSLRPALYKLVTLLLTKNNVSKIFNGIGHGERNSDVGIENIVIETDEVFDEQKGKKIKRPLIKTIHPIFNLNGDQVGTKSFDLAQESSGTLRFLSFIQEVLILLERGGVFVIDELSARLHPLLTKFIVDLFQYR